MDTLDQILHTAATQWPDSQAYVYEAASLTFSELAGHADRISYALTDPVPMNTLFFGPNENVPQMLLKTFRP